MSSRRVPLLLGLLGAALIVAPAILPGTPRLVFNTTASAPIGLYGLAKAEPSVGDWAMVRPPRRLALWMAARRYLPLNVPLIKRVSARGGQRVCVHQGRVLIDGRPLATARRHDHWGRPLEAWSGCRRLAADEVFLLNPGAPDSLDGRYFGPLPVSAVVGRLTPLWTSRR